MVGSNAILIDKSNAQIGKTTNISKQEKHKNNIPSTLITPQLTGKYLHSHDKNDNTADSYKIEIVWVNVMVFVLLHLAACYGLYQVCIERFWFLYVYALFIGLIGGLGVTAGAHRLWAHRAYKAKWQLRVILMLGQSLAFQNCIYEWVRDHRVHHKFTDTNADPHNSRRGFFFAHMGWLMIKKHPDVKIKGKTVDMSDLDSDPIVRFQKKYFIFVMPIFCFLFPPLISYYFMGYSFGSSFLALSILRYVISLHITWLVNSAAHLWGYKPYDKNINPTDNRFVIMLAYGEGYHNYHHVFPWDYKAAELGSYFFNPTKVLIDFCGRIGWAYDLKTVSVEMIRKRIRRTGDGTHPISIRDSKDLTGDGDIERVDPMIWGWDDRDMSAKDKNDAFIINKKDD